jgi:sec-independent protein translocase protein TatC
LTEKREMGFFDHLEELRWHLVRSFAAMLVLSIVAFLFKHIVFDIILLSPGEPSFITNTVLCRLAETLSIKTLCINQVPIKLINIQLSGQFITHIKISMITGFIIAFPYMVWELWRFIKPALYVHELQHSRAILFYVSLLFFTGLLLGYFIITPISIHFLGNYRVSESVSNTINLNSYIGIVSSICFATGIIFELPVLTWFLTKMGLLGSGFMIRYRKHSIIIMLILSAVITPPDVFSQLMICFPLLGLYEFSIFIAKNTEKRRILLG